MRLLALLGFGLAVWVAFAASEEDDSLTREKRQLPTPIQLGAGTSFGILALWSLVTLRLLSMAARFNNVNTTPKPFFVQPQPHQQLQTQQHIIQHPQQLVHPQQQQLVHPQQQQLVHPQQQQLVHPQQQQLVRPNQQVVRHPRPIIIQANLGSTSQAQQPQQQFVAHNQNQARPQFVAHTQPQPIQIAPQPVVVRFNLNSQPQATTPRSGYVNQHVRRRRQESRPAPPQVDVDKMLELIRKLDKANCIPLLICQLYANQKPENYGLFEKSVIKFVETYDGPAVQAGAAGAILKAAARLGKADKSEAKCSKAFPSCPISATQMRQVFKSTDAGSP